MRKSFIVVVFALFLSRHLSGQEGLQFSFAHYGTSSGLLSNQVNTVVQDEQGYIWTGTTDGLQRFDGIRYKTFRSKPGDSLSLPTNLIWQLLIDKKKNMWVLTTEGKLGIFDTKNFTFRKVAVKTRKAKSIQVPLKKLIEDEDGNIFFLLQGHEAVTWNEKKNEFSFEHNFIKQKEEWGIADIVQQPGTKKYWIAIQGGGLAVYNRETGNLSYAGSNAEHEKAIEKYEGRANPYALMFDKKGRLWFQSWWAGMPYAYCYDVKKDEAVLDNFEFHTYVKGYYETHGFYEQKDGTIWIRGLKIFARYNEKDKKFEQVHNGYLNERSIVFEMVHTLHEDREGNMWVATADNGLYRFHPSAQFFTNIAHINRVSGIAGSGGVMSFAWTRWGTILTGTWGDGIYHYNRNLELIPIGIKGIDGKSNPSVWGMWPSADSNKIWLSAQPGIGIIDQEKKSARFYNPPLLKNRTVRQVAEDKYGNLWLGMQGIGLYKWTASKGGENFDEGISQISAVPSMQVNKIMIDSKGLVWVGVAAAGAYVIDPSTDSVVMHFHDSATDGQQLPEEGGVSSILEYDDSTIVITTSTRISVYNRLLNKITVINTPEVMPGFIASMEKDKNGYLWIATTSGLQRVSIKNKIFVRFNREDGIDNDNFVLSSSIVLPDGRMLFGNNNQFVCFNPYSVKVSTDFPAVTITDFKVMNRPLLVDSLQQLKEIELAYNQNSLAIEFSSLTYNSAFLIRYKLDKLDKEWKQADKTNQAIYSYLPPGNYTFLIHTIDAEGHAGKNITKLLIRITPPFWKSWWFYSLLALGAASLLFWLDRERMKRKEAFQKMRSDIAGNLHEEINTALSNINILSEMAKLKAEKDPQKSKEYIEQIHSRSHNMIIAMDDMLWSINPANDNMQKTVERIEEYIDALRNRYGVNIEMLVDENVKELELNMKLRHEAFTLFKEGIKNLVSCGTKNCQIHIGSGKGKLLFTMQYDNEGCDMQQVHNLFHRQDMEKRLAAIHARSDVQVHKSSSVFLMQVPVK
ncbi:MAG: two-component regulator propeller domain-containing protein [Chitinophagaceae bacterium]|nr:two-component regulator propeller domain-containing protein [Chitinophagaceae bacterium]